MNTSSAQPFVLQALEALKVHDRRKAAALLRQDLTASPPGGQRWLSVAKLAATMGEKGIELEAMRQFSQTMPQTLDHLLAYAQVLSRFGRSAEALGLIAALPPEAQDHPAALHFKGMVASETGDFATAQSCFRRAVAVAPTLAQSWLGLSVIKTFAADDPDIAAMELALPSFERAPPAVRSTFLYALAKAWHDAGDTGKAARYYQDGAGPLSAANPYDSTGWQAFAAQTVRDFTPANLSRLTPSRCDNERVMFVTGLPRSGTTLVEQILTSHSKVQGGGELNLSDAMLLSAGDLSFAGAMAYQVRNASADPWGELGSDYLGMVAEQFGEGGHVVDKTLNQSRLLGLLLHVLPRARVIYLRRNPEDCALSIFRTHFRSTLPWSWSLGDIANHMRSEDRLYRHWTTVFPDRILTVPYEDLVSNPEDWTRRILAHVGLDEEPQVFAAHTHERSVMTASVAQVRAPITTSRVGSAAAYGGFMDEFRQTYYRSAFLK